MKISYARKFVKEYERADGKIKRGFKKRVELFNKDPFNPQLHNHPLSGKYSGYRSINITGDWRAVFLVIKEDGSYTVVSFEILGTHSQLYK